jgi:hypothetical protein
MKNPAAAGYSSFQPDLFAIFYGVHSVGIFGFWGQNAIASAVFHDIYISAVVFFHAL